MQGQSMATKQSSFGKDAGASVDGAESDAVVIKTAQSVFQRRRGEVQRLEACDHQ